MSDLTALDAVKAFVAKEAERLDPESRYIKELLDIVVQAKDLDDLERRLIHSRGALWAGYHAWNRMTLAEKLRANLITNETRMMRFETWEVEALRERVIPFLKARKTPPSILSLPCSHGEEAVSLAIEFKEAGLQEFTIWGYDLQPACIAVARSGQIPISGMPRYVTGVVSQDITRHLQFQVADVFEMPTTSDPSIARHYDLVVCRNFLGYFKYEVAKEILAKLSNVMADESYLMLDTFVVQKYGGLMHDFYAIEVRASGIPGPTPFFFRHKKGMEAIGRVTEREMR